MPIHSHLRAVLPRVASTRCPLRLQRPSVRATRRRRVSTALRRMPLRDADLHHSLPRPPARSVRLVELCRLRARPLPALRNGRPGDRALLGACRLSPARAGPLLRARGVSRRRRAQVSRRRLVAAGSRPCRRLPDPGPARGRGRGARLPPAGRLRPLLLPHHPRPRDARLPARELDGRGDGRLQRDDRDPRARRDRSLRALLLRDRRGPWPSPPSPSAIWRGRRSDSCWPRSPRTRNGSSSSASGPAASRP